MTLTDLLLIVAAVFFALDAFAAAAWGRFNRTAAGLCLVAVALAITASAADKALFS